MMRPLLADGRRVLRALVLASVALAGSIATLAASQDRLVIDPDGGRRIVGGFEYEFSAEGGNAIDVGRGRVYDVESAAPHRVQAWSLDDGGVLGIYGEGKGDGPGEWRHVRAIAAATNRVVVSDGIRVSRWDADGRFLGTWTPVGGAADVCLLGDEPAVPVPGGIGVAYRTSDGTTATIPSGVAPLGEPGASGSERSFRDLAQRSDVRIACGDDVAYVAAYNRITAYPIKGAPFDVPLPEPFAEAAVEAHTPPPGTGWYYPWYGSMSLDERGRIVLVSSVHAREFAAVVLDPTSGCHAFIVDDAPRHRWRHFMGVYRDSAVVAEWGTHEAEFEGQMHAGPTINSATGIWLMPLVADPESAALRAEAGCGEAG